jgi:organic hydroperoxide reductase OsmC/OhrA
MTSRHSEHRYEVIVEWIGNLGKGTLNYQSYGRDYTIRAGAKPPISGSSDPSFRGDATRWNPEDLLLASLSACHELWYLSLCANAGIVVIAYRDRASGVMVEDPAKGGRFTEVMLRPHVVIQAGDNVSLAERLHHEAHAKCFIANSVNFPVGIQPAVETETVVEAGLSDSL